MKCPGLHCDGCRDGGGWALVAVVAVLAIYSSAIITLIGDLILVAGLTAAGIFAAIGAVVVWAWRRGWRPSLSPLVAWNPEIPADEVPAVDGRQRRAAAAPQQHLHLHFHGTTAAEAAEVIRLTEGRTS